ncbi:iron-sulfur cluster repair di-iron protein [Halovenus sp. WSH3]|uniref:Iron-sulfur cluster repair di-iron protein n=1 Tax=Halovenus carboxidivorans TaxID=2692199 RepID=A0A6B0TBD8_9EURY|nr:iron-sulfur cluster repair di-iron protein [Halovenus carboxidivorans]MXR52943.1 iron-sulfur cluster repair di-iron protein [Halovenus carboxidivorans]
MSTDIDPERELGALVAEQPQYARVFESFDLDYCCGGDESLATACAKEDLSVEEVREALRDIDDGDDQPEWETPSELVEYIVETHHEYLREELPDLEELVETVSRVHGDDHPELREVDSLFPDLAEEMREHIAEEEEEGFPIIRKLDRGEELSADERATLRAELDHYESDHEETAARLDRIAELTNGYEVPDDACPSYRSMLARLEDLEEDTHMHVHRENNVLFPEVESMVDA